MPDINMSEIISLAEGHKVIALIKEYRSLSGLGLKEAKEAVDACKTGQFPDGPAFNINAIRDLFLPYVSGGLDEGLAKGMALATEHWQALGFEDPAQLFEIVARNFKKLYGRRRATLKK
jgi:hypothetical protein